jgi:hypothetical protein
MSPKAWGTVAFALGLMLLNVRPAPAQLALPATSLANRPLATEATTFWQEQTVAEGEAEAAAPAEAEFVGSTIFQSGFFGVRVWGPLLVEAHYFGMEDTDAGVTGLSWEFRHRGLRILPGLAWTFSSKNRPGPAATVRWGVETASWVSQGLWAVSLRAGTFEPENTGAHESEGDTNAEVYAHILDGVHVSRRFGRWEAGPMLEHIRYRDENEWKGGARVAWAFGRGFKIVTQAVAPDPELRLGLAWEP